MGKRARKSQSKEEPCSKEDTILLDSTDDTDIIQSSIIKYESDYDFIKRGKINSSRLNYTPNTPLQSKSSNLRNQRSSFNSPRETSNASKLGFTKTTGLADTPLPVEENRLLQTPCTGKNPKEANSIMNKLISTLKKTPVGPYLSKSKLRNIEQWLTENDVETVRTPPFANLSITPMGSVKKRFYSRWKNKDEKQEESSIDSEVEGVLKAVYGEDWRRETVKTRPKTEPKKKSKFFSPETETKNRKAGGIHSVRRNILSSKKLCLVDSSDEENKFDSSILSGVGMINLNSSCSGDEQTKPKTANSVRKARNREAGNRIRSLSLSSVENVKSNVPPLNQVDIKKRTPKKPASEATPKAPKKTFLASLSVSTPTSRCHPDAQHYKVNFKSKKDELVKKLYKLYNNEVFDGKLIEDLNFSWNVKLRGTAGYCYNKRITKSTGDVIRLSRIEFSTKIVDRADRLRDTMIHELCHAASWMIDGVLDGHGDIWTKWASRAMDRFPELPTIKRCHNYDIVSKYLYKCTSCGYSIKRHSKSINMERKRCGHCYGAFELLINKKRKGKGEVPEFDTTRTLPTPNKFAMFVKENYHSVKSSKANAKHSEVMKVLSQQYALIKNGSASAKKILQE